MVQKGKKTMFGGIFFLLLVLVLISLVPETTGANWIASPEMALLVGLAFYGILLLFLYLQGQRSRFAKPRALILVQGELLAFFILFFFGLGAARGYAEWGPFAYSQTLTSLVPISLYLFGLWSFHYGWASYPWRRQKERTQKAAATIQVSFMAPFAVPFLLFLLLFDVLSWIPVPLSDNIVTLLFGGVIALLFLLMPWVMVHGWQCRPMPDTPLHRRLEALCRKSRFRHGGMKIWTAMDEVMTAAIIGVAPPFRYILFTKSLLDEFPQEEIEAILLHEVGHNVHRHLLIYPFIIMGMVVLAAIFSLLLGETYQSALLLLQLHKPSPMWNFLFPLAAFVGYALLFGLYFRWVFGSFSRLFEKQADLYIFATDTPPQSMSQALHHLGVATGYTHHRPSWHHGSLQSRIDLLQQAIKQPELIHQCHRRVRRRLFIYFALLGIGVIIAAAPAFANLSPFDKITEALETLSHLLAQVLTGTH